MTNRITAARSCAPEIRVAMRGKVTGRNLKIITRVLAGESYAVVGSDFNLSHERVRCICFITFRKLGFKL